MLRKFLAACLVLLWPLAIVGEDKSKKAYELIYEDVQLLKQKLQEVEAKIVRNAEDLKQLIVLVKDLQTQFRLFQSEQSGFKESVRILPTQYQVFLQRLEELNQQLIKISEDLITLKAGGPAGPQPQPEKPEKPKPGQKKGKPAEEKSQPPPIPTAPPQEIYNMAYSDYLKGNFDLAIEGFKQYIQQFPDSPLADNSLYWIGECYFSQKKFREAIDQFNDLILNYPNGDKAAAAYLKKGISLAELGKKDEALAAFKLLVSKYPLEEETKIAQQKIKELQAQK